jgi:YVTN family beta-propeller protein
VAVAGGGWAVASQLPLVGRTDNGARLPTGQLITPAGAQVELSGRPNAVAVRPDGKTAAVLAASSGAPLAIVDLASKRVLQRAPAPSASYDGIAYSADGTTLYSSHAGGSIGVTPVNADGTLGATKAISLPVGSHGNPYPGGLATGAPGSNLLYVALSRDNALGVVDLASGSLQKEIAVGNAPHSVVVDGTTAYVTNEGGRPAQPGDTTNDSAGTAIVSDPVNGGSVTGTVSVVDLTTGAQTGTIAVGRHPTALHLEGRYLFVTNTNSDTVSVIDTATRAVASTISVAPFVGAPYGSMPNGITVVGGHVVVTLGADNALAFYDWAGPRQAARFEGLMPTGWFPGAVAAAGTSLVVTNVKGVGSVADADAGHAARSVGGEVGSVSVVPFPSPKALGNGTKAVSRNNGWRRADGAGATNAKPSRPGVAPVAIPERVGEPSLIKHVVYIIKENRTYDQVLGDIGRGNSDPSLVQFGAQVSPNHHALATQFPLLDNFYVSGRRSNDGHNWAVQANAPDYLEKGVDTQRVDNATGGTPPSSGFDALLYLPSGFIWENALRHGLTFADFGEYTSEEFTPPARSDVPSLSSHLAPEYPGFNLQVPDVDRARIFLNHLATYEATKSLPNLITLTLSNDHTGGSNPMYPTPPSQVADNDAALGMIVDGLSHSSFWSSTAVFVTEDDAQGGADHVDGHRSPALVVSPYARRGMVDSTFTTQVGVVRTIEQILGLPPMNQMDLAADPMREAFTDTADLTPYTAIAAQVPMAMNPPLASLTGIQREWAQAIMGEDLTHLDAADENLLNHDVWYATKGFDQAYPGEDRVLHPSEVVRVNDKDG